MTDLALFDAGPYQEPWTLPPTPLDESPDRRRTRRQAEALARRRHPLSLVIGRTLPLHPEAAPIDDRGAPGRRCGNCRFRELIFTNGNRKWAKCLAEAQYAAPEAPLLRISHGAATDVRAWWSACANHEWGDKVSDDAARCVPEPDPVAQEVTP